MVTSTASLPVVGFAPRAVPASAGRAGGLLVGLASALAFSSSGPFVKPLLEAGWSLGAALLVRMSLAALVLSPALILALRRDPGLLRRNARLIVAFAATGVAGCQIFYFAAMARMPVAVALLIQYLAPVLLVLWAWARTRRAPSRLVAAGSVVAITGLVLVVDVSSATFDLIGTCFALLAAVCVATYFLICERAGEQMPPLALAAVGLATGAVIVAVLCVVGVLPLAAPAVDVSLGGLQVPALWAILWVGLVATTLGYGLGVKAIPMLGARVASFVGLSEVLFALGFAWLLLGEAPTVVQIVGGVVLIAGVVLVRLDGRPVSTHGDEGASVPPVLSP